MNKLDKTLDNAEKKVYNSSRNVIEEIIFVMIGFIKKELYGKLIISFSAGKIVSLKKEITEKIQ